LYLLLCNYAHIKSMSKGKEILVSSQNNMSEWSDVTTCGLLFLIFSFMCIFCRSFYVLLYLFFWPLYCLFFFDSDDYFGIFWPLCCLFFFNIRFWLLVSSNCSCFVFVRRWWCLILTRLANWQKGRGTMQKL
jgi:hypothetical protein